METSEKHAKLIVLQYVSLIVISIITGILIGLFSVAIKYLFDGINKIYESSIETAVPIAIYSSACLIVVFAFYILIRYFKLSLGKGSIVLIRYLSNEQIKIYEYPLLLLGFFISLFSGIPVGGAEISQCIGVGLASEAYKRTDIKDNDSFDSISAASFGAFFMSPLAAFSYSLESRKWKVTISYIIKSIVAISIAVGTTYLTKLLFNLQNHYLFRLAMFESFSWKSLWLYAFMGIVIAGVAFILNLSSLKLSRVFSNKKKYKDIATVFTVIILIVALVCTFFGLTYQYYTFSLAGYDGRRFILLFNKFKLGLLVGTVFLWGFYILLIPHSNLVGGKMIPLMTVGALIGLCFVWNGKDNHIIKPDEYFMMITVGMFSLFGVVYKKPLTGFLLALTISKWSVIPYQILPLIFAIAPGYILLLITKLPSWNECLGLSDSLSMAEQAEKDQKNLKK